MRTLIVVVLASFVFSGWGSAQLLSQRPADSPQPPVALGPPSPSSSIALTVPTGTPLKVALEKDVRIRKVGQTIHGKVIEPVYAFDKMVVPAGSEVSGKVAAISGVTKKKRTLAAMNGDFSPSRQVQIEFDELRLADGRQFPLQTSVSPGSQAVLQFVTAQAPRNQGKIDAGKNLASRKIGEARQEVKREWDTVKQEVHAPGKMHRLERYGLAQLPYRPQYLDAGTTFYADIQQPLDFGTEGLKPETLTNIGTPPPSGSLVHALLVTPLSSATAKKDDPVEAVISQPLVVSGHLFLPEGSRLEGSVLQARPARRLGRNGLLRIAFHQVVPPDGVRQQVEASLEGVAVAQGENLRLDAEGGAQVTSPPTRYLTTAISVVLAASSVAPDNDRGLHRGNGDASGGAANGASGFRFLGTVAGALAHSRAVNTGFGFYGAAISVYAHFLAHGRDVVYPKDTSMVIGLGTRQAAPAAKAASAKDPG